MMWTANGTATQDQKMQRQLIKLAGHANNQIYSSVYLLETCIPIEILILHMKR